MTAAHLQRLAPWAATGLAAVVGYGEAITGGRLGGDETPYACAFSAMLAGGDPYACARFFYPPPMAALGAFATQLASLDAVVLGMRSANLAAATAIVAWSVRRLPLPPLLQALAGAAVMLLGPSVREAMAVGNLSPAAALLALAGLAAWPRRPVAAGVLLGASIVLKPIAAVVVPLLLVHRSTLSNARRAQSIASLAAAATVSLALLPWLALLPAMLAHAPDHGQALNSVSLQRLAYLLGAQPNALAVFAIVGAAFGLALRRRALEPEAFAYAGCAASLLSLPAVWCHTFILAYPLIAAALARAISGAREAPPSQRSRAQLELALVLAGCVIVLQSDLFGALAEYLPRAPAALALAAGLTLPTTLAIYAGRCARVSSLRIAAGSINSKN